MKITSYNDYQKRLTFWTYMDEKLFDIWIYGNIDFERHAKLERFITMRIATLTKEWYNHFKNSCYYEKN